MNNNNKNTLLIRDIYLLWKLIFSNKYITKIINNHLKLFNINYYRIFNNENQYNNFKYKSYITIIRLSYIPNGCFSENIESLYLEYYSNSFKLFNGLKSLTLSINTNLMDFNIKELKFINLKSLVLKFVRVFSNDSNLEILASQLPQTLKTLELSNYPSSIKKETLNSDGLLKINSLIICGIVNFEINKSDGDDGIIFPQSLTSLVMDECYEYTLKNIKLPNYLKYLKLSNSQIDINLPKDSIKPIELPSSLKYLNINCHNFNNVKIPSSIKKCHIYSARPNSILLNHFQFNQLYHLEINCQLFKQPNLNNNNKNNNKDKDLVLYKLPNSIKKLIFIDRFNQKLIPNQFPSSLTWLEFRESFNNDLYSLVDQNLFPNTLTFLNLGNFFNRTIGENVLPNSLKSLILGNQFSKQLIHPLPNSLEYLKIENPLYNHSINLNNPFAIIDVSNYYKQFINQNNSSSSSLIYLKLRENPSTYLDKFNLTNQCNQFINLQYLDISFHFNLNQLLNDLSINIKNNLKTLILNDSFNDTINLNHYQNLEIIEIGFSNCKITTLKNDEKNNNNNNDFNFYNLKSIKVNFNNLNFLNSIQMEFYYFIKLIK